MPDHQALNAECCSRPRWQSFGRWLSTGSSPSLAGERSGRLVLPLPAPHRTRGGSLTRLGPSTDAAQDAHPGPGSRLSLPSAPASGALAETLPRRVPDRRPGAHCAGAREPEPEGPGGSAAPQPPPARTGRSSEHLLSIARRPAFSTSQHLEEIRHGSRRAPQASKDMAAAGPPSPSNPLTRQPAIPLKVRQRIIKGEFVEFNTLLRDTLFPAPRHEPRPLDFIPRLA